MVGIEEVCMKASQNFLDPFVRELVFVKPLHMQDFLKKFPPFESKFGQPCLNQLLLWKEGDFTG